MGIPAKLVAVRMVSNGFSIADPHDPGTLDVVGFYATVLNLVTTVVPKRPTNEILKSVLLTFMPYNDGTEGYLDIRATDTENEITGWVPCEAIGDSFSIAVDAKTLKQCVHQLRRTKEPIRIEEGVTTIMPSPHSDGD